MKSIMPKDELWKIEKVEGYHKHHIFGGANRKLSEKYGLYIYLRPELHNMSDRGIHFDPVFMQYAHENGQRAWMQYYNKTKEDFIKVFGKSFI